jgi:gas vesicle protein
MDKTKLYKDLYERMELSLKEKFFMEACWIQYAIIEDRFNSVIKHAYPEKGEQFLKSFRGLDRKLEHIVEKIHPKDQDCLKTVHKALLEKIKKWKDKRNTLMHEITKTTDIASVQKKLEKLAPEGKSLTSDLSNRVRKYKELVKKRKK